MNSKVTIFQSLDESSTPFHVNVLEVLDRIKTGKKSKATVDQIRGLDDIDQINELKDQLPVICFSADLYKISDDSVNSHSGVICIDFEDYKTREDLNDAKENISSDPHTFAVFESVSGKGLKVLIKIPESISDHPLHFTAIKNYFNDDHLNTTDYNVSRSCYESYDPGLYLNQDSDVWTDKAENTDNEKSSGLEKIGGKTEKPTHETISFRKFWKLSQKGAISIDHYSFRSFLTDNGFFKYYPEGSKNFIFVRKVSNRVSNVKDQHIKDFVLEYIDDRVGDPKVWGFFADKTRFFKEDFLSFLPSIDIQFIEDGKDSSYVFYQNVAVKVTKGKISTIKYEDLPGWVWEDQMIDRDYAPSKTDDCDFKKFISNISGEKQDRIKSIESTIGFLLHGYKDPSKCPAVILNDEVISDNPEGGTGKGLFAQGVAKVKKMVSIDGKRFDKNATFAYQTVQQDTQILTFDDVKMNFDFESLFSLITEGITLEKKNKDAIKLKFENSPKILITTNYAIKGSGNSFDRRKWELEFKQFYRKDFTPLDEFNRRLFDDWDEKEWRRFDNYMLKALQSYLTTGLQESKLGNLKTRKFIAETSHQFWEWVNDTSNPHNRAGTKVMLNRAFMEFVEAYPDYNRTGRMRLSNQRFKRWMHSYGLYKFNSKPSDGRSSEGHWVEFIKKENEQVKMKM